MYLYPADAFVVLCASCALATACYLRFAVSVFTASTFARSNFFILSKSPSALQDKTPLLLLSSAYASNAATTAAYPFGVNPVISYNTLSGSFSSVYFLIIIAAPPFVFYRCQYYNIEYTQKSIGFNNIFVYSKKIVQTAQKQRRLFVYVYAYYCYIRVYLYVCVYICALKKAVPRHCRVPPRMEISARRCPPFYTALSNASSARRVQAMKEPPTVKTCSRRKSTANAKGRRRKKEPAHGFI